VESNGRWQMRWDDNGSRFDVNLSGTIAFTDDLTDVQSLSDGGSFTLRDWTGSILPHTVTVTAAGGTLTREYFVGGRSRGWDDEGRRFLAGHLPLLVRRSGIGAESRVKSIYASKGVTGVLDEVDRLLSDYARRLYLVSLIDVAHPDSSGVMPVLQRAGARINSDYDKRGVLEHAASKVTLDRRAALAYVQTLATMKSDYDQREALNALTKSGAGLDGDAAFQAVAHMTSSYDKRLVLSEIIEHGGISIDTKKGVIDAARGMQSDYDRRLVLQAYVGKFGVEPAVRDAFFAAVDAMRSDYDRAETLLTSLKDQPVDAAARAAYVTSAERLRSRYDQDRVLAAVVRAERQ
jgi:bla regulator protein blaR1